MSISSLAEDSALRFGASSTLNVSATAAAAAAAAAAATKGASADDAAATGRQAAADSGAQGAVSAVGPLSQLVKYIPTETLTLYVAVQAALGDLTPPSGGGAVCTADFSSHWAWVWVLLGGTVLLTTGLSYRSQKNARPDVTFTFPVFEVLAASAAFLVWSLSLPSTPLRDFCGYDYSAWNSVVLLGGTIIIAAVGYVLGKTVTWQKVAT